MERMSKSMEKLLKAYDLHCDALAQKTLIDGSLSLAERSRSRKHLEKSYTDWFQYFFPQYAKVPSANFHKKIARLIINNPKCSLLAEVYRSGAKSVHLCMGIPLYLYVTKQLHFMVLVGQTEEKAKKLISDIQSQLTHNQRFIHFYGKKYKYGDWSEGDFTTTDGIKFVSLGIGQSPRGLRELAERPDYIVVDDVDTKERCYNDLRSQRAVEWVWEDLKGTFDEGGEFQRFIVANNSFHKNCVINLLKKDFELANEKARQRGDKKKHFIVTVKAVKNLKCFDPTWPEKTSADYWRKKFDDTPYRSFMREYMHMHIVEGLIFKNEYIQYKQRLKYAQYDAICCYGDLSYKDSGDFKALVFVGKKGREFHVLDTFIRQTSRYNAALWLYEKVAEDHLLKYNITYTIEGLFAQDEFVSDFDTVGDEKGWYVPVVADKKPKTNKFDRIESMVGYFERGNTFFNTPLKNSMDGIELVNQLMAFQKGSGAHDDGPDALQASIAKLNISTISNIENIALVSRKKIINKNRY